MALEFNEMLGKPFADPIKKELEKRRSLNQRYETSPTLHNPYFNLQRIEKLSDQNEIDAVKPSRDNIKFWKLNKLSKDGLNDIKKKINSGGNAKAPVGITDVSIELKDYTFQTVEVNFIVPDVNDWQAFKDTWLIFGAPVQYEFGRESLVEIEDNKDLTPEKEIREGIIANFSWNLGEQKRTITGSLTIYSSTYIELTRKAHSLKHDGINISSNFKEALRNIQFPDNITFDDIKNIHGDPENPNVNNQILEKENKNDVEKKYAEITKDFYALMTTNEYKKRFYKMENSRNDKEINFYSAQTSGFDLSEKEGKISNLIPLGIDIINIENKKITQELQRRLEQEGVESNFKKPFPEEYNLQEQKYINYVKNNTPFKYDDGTSAVNFKDWFKSEYANFRVSNDLLDIGSLPDNNEVISSGGVPDSVISVPNNFLNYGQKYLEWIRTNNYKEQLNNQSNNVSKTSIHKFALSELSLSNSNQNEYQNDVYFYVSMKFINDVLNGIIKKHNKLYSDDHPLLSIDLTDIKIRDLSFLGFGSAEPDKVIVNPWNKKYSKNPKSNDNNDPNYKEFILDNKGEYNLFENVFLSAPTVMRLAQSTDSPLGFVEKLINEIESATNGLLNLKKIQKYRVNDNKVLTKNLTYFDPSVFEDRKNDDIEYYTFNLFDHKEKIRNIDVNSNLSDDFSQYSYFKSLGSLYNTENLFFYEDVYYNNDGSVVKGKLNKLHSNSLTKKEKQKIRDKYNIEKNNQGFINQFPEFKGATNFNVDYEINKYMINGKELIKSYNKMFDNLLNSDKKRLSKFLQSKETDDFERDQTIGLLTFIEAYFNVLTELHKLKNNPFENSDSTTTIPLKVDITIDGIASIMTGQTFKINLSSFPMAYNISNTTPLFVVSTLNHSITEQNDWETTIGGFLYIPASAQRDAIYKSDSLKELVDSENARLKMIKEIFINNILSILDAEG